MSRPTRALLLGLTAAIVVVVLALGASPPVYDERVETAPGATAGTEAIQQPEAVVETPSTTAAAAISPAAPGHQLPDPDLAVAERVVSTGDRDGLELTITLSFESQIADTTSEELAELTIATLNDPRGWPQAGFSFVEDPSSQLRVVLAEPDEVDELCWPLQTAGRYSCQNGAVVALNATRWRHATTGWDGTVEEYRIYLVNHEVGHLIGQRHPTPRCPVTGAPAAVMEQQTKGLEGCIGNGWPRPWEIDYAKLRPVRIGPLPAWAPDPIPPNREDR